MGKVFLNKQFSNYLGENRAILDTVESYVSDQVTPTPTPSVTPTMTPTTTPTPTPSPVPVFNLGAGFDAEVTSFILDSSDDLYVVGNFLGYKSVFSRYVAKLDTNGNIDTSFASAVSAHNLVGATGICEDETGNYIYVWGGFGNPKIAKIDKSTGANIWTGPTINNAVSNLLVDPNNGDIYIVGTFTTVGGTSRNRIARLSKTGVLDTTIFTGTNFNNPAIFVIFNNNGNIVVTGQFTEYNGTTANRLLEIDVNTGNDTGFWSPGATQISQWVYQRTDNQEYVFVGNGGQIKGVSVGKVAKFDVSGTNIPFTTALGGIVPPGYLVDEVNNFIYIGDIQGVNIRRYDYSTGATDAAFEANLSPVLPQQLGNGQAFRKVVIDSQNRIYWCGLFTFIDGNSRNRFVRLNQNGTQNTI
jgi:hypothetical protein